MDLALRFTAAETSLERPDVAAFTAVDHALLREQEADHDDTFPIGDLMAASVVASELRLIDDEPARRQAPVFVRIRHTPIPAIPLNPLTMQAPVTAIREVSVADEFVLDDHIRGHFAWPQSRRSPSRAGAALVLAACIPMFVPDVAAAQAAGARQPAPSSVVPPAPAPVVVTPPPVTLPPTPEVAPSATPPGVPNLQAILYAMRGHEATIFAAGRVISGLLVGVEGDFVMMVDEARDGKIAMIPKSQITEVRGKVRSVRHRGPLPPDGIAQLAGGGVLVGIGGPLTISGLVFVGITPSFTPLWLPQLLPGLLMLGGGISLLVVGSRRRRAFREAIEMNNIARRMSPSFGRTPHGSWTGGLSLRF